LLAIDPLRRPTLPGPLDFRDVVVAAAVAADVDLGEDASASSSADNASSDNGGDDAPVSIFAAPLPGGTRALSPVPDAPRSKSSPSSPFSGSGTSVSDPRGFVDASYSFGGDPANDMLVASAKDEPYPLPPELPPLRGPSSLLGEEGFDILSRAIRDETRGRRRRSLGVLREDRARPR
jgi:hypothetical protein